MKTGLLLIDFRPDSKRPISDYNFNTNSLMNVWPSNPKFTFSFSELAWEPIPLFKKNAGNKSDTSGFSNVINLLHCAKQSPKLGIFLYISFDLIHLHFITQHI